MLNKRWKLGTVWRIFLLLSLFISDCTVVSARIVYVDGKQGKDSNDGLAPHRPVATIQKGANIVQGGDLMIIGEGTYYEEPTFKNLGSSESKQVWILGQPRGSVTIYGGWRESHQGRVHWSHEGNGIWSAQHHEDPMIGWYNGSVLLRLLNRHDLDRSAAQTRAHFVKVPRQGFAYENGRIYLRLPNDKDPNGKSVGFSTPPYFRRGRNMVKIDNSPYLIFDGINFEGSGQSCLGFTRNSHHATIRNVKFRYCIVGATLSDDSVIEWTEYGLPGLRAYADELLRLNNRIDIFELAKEYPNNGSQEGSGGLEGSLAATWTDYSSKRCEFRYNWIHQSFDGEKLGLFEESRSHHNVYEDNFDNHVELEHWVDSQHSRNLELDHNLMIGISMSPVSHQNSGIRGPHFVHHNVIRHDFYEPNRVKLEVIKHDVPNASGGVFYYHNLIFGKDQPLMDSRNHGTNHFTYTNNIFVFTNMRGGQPNIRADFNLLVNNQDVSWLRGNNGKYLGGNMGALKLTDPDKFNFGLRSGSPAQDAGVVLAKFNENLRGKPDIGPFEPGETPGSDWPRPRTATYILTLPQGWQGPLPPSMDHANVESPVNLRIMHN